MKRLDSFQTKAEAIAYIRENVAGCAGAKEAQKYFIDHLPRESYYQGKIIKFLKATYPGAFVWKATAGAYSRQGIPDVCAVIDGRFYGFEVKRPFIGTPTIIQKETIKQIRAAGGVVAVVCFPEEVKKIVEDKRK